MSPPIGPEEARFILESTGFPALEYEHGVTARVISALPGEHMSFRPVPGARTAGEIARHIAGIELRFLGAAGSGTFVDYGPGLADAADGAAVVECYQIRYREVRSRLAGVSGRDLLRPLDYKGLVRLPALGFVQFALNHTIHHRGQLSVYLRMVGIGVPPIYG
ncbi:MAG: DinB family protein [Gemmatimonadales bacterium]